MWQDVALSVCSFVFAVSLMPILINPNARVPLWTSVPTCLALNVTTLAQVSLGLVVAPILTWLMACAWCWISFNRATKK